MMTILTSKIQLENVLRSFDRAQELGRAFQRQIVFLLFRVEFGVP